MLKKNSRKPMEQGLVWGLTLGSLDDACTNAAEAATLLLTAADRRELAKVHHTLSVIRERAWATYREQRDARPSHGKRGSR